MSYHNIPSTVCPHIGWEATHHPEQICCPEPGRGSASHVCIFFSRSLMFECGSKIKMDTQSLEVLRRRYSGWLHWRNRGSFEASRDCFTSGRRRFTSRQLPTGVSFSFTSLPAKLITVIRMHDDSKSQKQI